MTFFGSKQRVIRLLVVGAASLLIAIISGDQAMMQQPPTSKAPFTPRQTPPHARYVGTQTCALCHTAQAATQPATAMARALEPIAGCQMLREHPRLELRLGKYAYSIVRTGEQSIYAVTDGTTTIAEPILWCFGKGQAGQTYVFRHQGQFYESRVSFYSETKGLDVTLGAPTGVPRTVAEAAGRVMQSADTKDCFGCHATAAVSEGNLQLEKLTPGITCEACHGPGGGHVALAKAGKVKGAPDKQIFNPARLSPYDLSQQFCGDCHRSWEQVMLMGLRGIGNVRFQPYRIVYSPCYNPDDRRISCTACHDPHRELERNIAAYDVRCLACHQTKPTRSAVTKNKTAAPKSTAAACKVGTAKCASCHMPRYEMPGSHFKFTDHLIRVVKPGEAYPN